MAVGFVAAFDNAHGTNALDGFARTGRDGQFAADGNVCAVADKTDIVVDIQDKIHINRRGGRCFFWGFAQYNHIIVEGRHGGFLRTEHTVVGIERAVERYAFSRIVEDFGRAGELQSAVWTREGTVFVEDDVHVDIGVGVGKVDRAFELNRAATVEFEAVDDPFLTLQA